MVKRGLGRGLSSLIPSLATENTGLEEISVSEICANPSQPRLQFDAEAFSELVASVGRHGIVQPVVVRPKGGTYELIAGERRWRAAREAGLASIPAIIKTSNDSESLQLALIENIQREDLNAIEEAVAYRRLADDFGCTQVELAELVGKNRATVANTMRLLQLPESVQGMIGEGRLSSGHARALLALDGSDDQIKLAQRVAAEGLSVRQTEDLARLWQLAQNKTTTRKPSPSPEIKAIARRLGRALGTKVRAKLVGNKVRVEIELKDADDLRRLEGLIVKNDLSG
ncbi:MAG: ParB/RepB/Spo0J family partition protein [Actinomycetota bacterium]|nr:ParB/RepB/Spo0J family partition protein [Actinomycetota bacterium]